MPEVGWARVVAFHVTGHFRSFSPVLCSFLWSLCIFSGQLLSGPFSGKVVAVDLHLCVPDARCVRFSATTRFVLCSSDEILQVVILVHLLKVQSRILPSCVAHRLGGARVEAVHVAVRFPTVPPSARPFL